MKIDFSTLSGDATTRFRDKCMSCTRCGACRLRIRIRRSKLSGNAVISDFLSYSNTKDMDILCSDFKESRRKDPAFYRQQRFLNTQVAKESRGQLRLFS